MNNLLYFRFTRVCLYLLCIIFFTSCSKDDDEPPPTDEVIIARQVQVIDDKTWDDNILAIDTTDFTIRLSKDISSTQSFKAGDYIVSSSGEGMLRKIESISSDNNELVLQTEFASLTDVVEQGEIDFEEPLIISQVESIDYHYAGVKLITDGSKGTDQTQFNWDINVVLHDLDGNESTTGDQIKVVGNFETNFSLIARIKINLRLRIKEVKFGFKSSEDLNLKLISDVKYNLKKELKLATVKLKPKVVFIGPVPVVFTKKLDIILGIDGSSDGSLTSEIDQGLSFKAGIKYERGEGWSPYSDFDKTFKAKEPHINGKASAGVNLKPELSVKVYGVAGPFANIKLYSRLESDYLSEALRWKLYGGIMMGAGVKMEILDRYELGYSKSDILKDELLLSQSTKPVSIPIVTTDAVTNHTSNSATSGGNVTSDGGTAVTGRGVCWSTSESPTTANNKTNNGTGTGIFTSNLTDLNANTIYYVRAYATNIAGTGYGNQVDFKTKPEGLPPEANFTGFPTTIASGQSVQFTDQSTNSPTSWDWNFGDEKTSPIQNPVHTYSSPGIYTVTLRASNSYGSDTETKTNFITVGDVPEANFTGFPTTIASGQSVQFTDQSTNSPTSWSWNFGDNGTSPSPNPSHPYSSPGIYTVTLTVSNSYGSDTETKTNFITVGDVPEANFTGFPTTITSGQSVQFTDQSTNSPTSWSWNFGDNGTNPSQNPSHVYNTAGLYTVTLTASNSFGSDEEQKVGYITVDPPPISGIIFNPELEYGEVTDREGNIYKTIQIGSQTWMAENLKTTKYNNGTDIPLVTNNTAWLNLTTPAYCWYDNDISFKNLYGALYNWYSVNTGILCPVGWHVPSDNEWIELEMHLGMYRSETDLIDTWRGSDEGGKLKEISYSHWSTPNTEATNESGFTALPGGDRYGTDGVYHDIRYYAGFWSNSGYGTGYAWNRNLYFANSMIYRGLYRRTVGFSVRCLKDE